MQPWREELTASNDEEGKPDGHRLEHFYARLTLARAPDDFDEFVSDLMDELGLTEETRNHLREQGLGRLLVYRNLVRNNVKKAILTAIPRAAARMDSVFDEYLEGYLDERGPRSRFLRHLTGEFLDYCNSRELEDPRLAPHILELARLEAVRIEVAAARVERYETVDLDLDRRLLFAEASRLLYFEHAVHRLPDSEEDRTEPERKPTHLMAYRDSLYKVRYLDLSPLAASILTRLREGLALGPAIKGACAEGGFELSQDVLNGTAQLLSDLSERGVLLGAAQD